MPDYNQLSLYVMYASLIVFSALGAYLHIYSNDIAQYVLLVVVGHFMGVLTPPPLPTKNQEVVTSEQVTTH